jgi:hypothetical protein
MEAGVRLQRFVFGYGLCVSLTVALYVLVFQPTFGRGHVSMTLNEFLFSGFLGLITLFAGLLKGTSSDS